MGKNKGTRAERELFNMFYNAKLQPLRAAGSGSTPIPAPDLIVGKRGKILAIECKSLKAEKKYFDKSEIEQLRKFAKNFGAIAYIGIRFDREGWYFIQPNKLEKSKKGNYAISKADIKKKGVNFKTLIK